ncbi:MAG: hypothetical protein MK110_08260 [Fuerstiella sp.]|nr:hypothetical protein [Fuerstiella sp.]
MPSAFQRPTSLLPRATCPHCWTRFPPEEALWVSAHPDLDDDEIVTPRGQRRFLPTRLNENGHAIDVKGEVCHHLACPRCHLTVVRASLELNPLFFSILGAPGSGKSYYLAASIWQLRKAFSSKFQIAFGDADPASNRIVNQYEEILFLNNDRNAPVTLPKTEKEGDLYESVVLGGRPVLFPRPFVFSVKPQPQHPRFSHLKSMSRALCLYDNAGEHFMPGEESSNNPGTQHLSVSKALLFLFDPTQHHEFRNRCSGTSTDPQMGERGWNFRQDKILLEAESRIRAQTGLRQADRDSRPLIIVVTKYDAWNSLMDSSDIPPDYFLRTTRSGKTALDIDRLERMSAKLRKLMAELAPEFVSAADGFSKDVTYIAASALGQGPELIKTDDREEFIVRPADIKPVWTEIPLLYAIYRTVPGMIMAYTGKNRNSDPRRPNGGGGL